MENIYKDKSDIYQRCRIIGLYNLNASLNLARYADGLSVKASGVVNADIATVKEEVKLGRN